MPILPDITCAIGHTPLIRLSRYADLRHIPATILAKVESANPGGSAKDRVALALIQDAEARGALKPGGAIIEPTSGNTGIGLAMAAAARGYRCIIVMPDSASVERRQLMAAYGAQVVLTPGQLGMTGAIAKAEAIQQATPGSIIPGQFVNQANPQAHYAATGPELWADAAGQVDAFIAGVGTGGTISGTGRYLKEQGPVRVIGVEPADSPLLTEGHAGPHPLQGIGANFVPDTLDRAVLDEVLTATGPDAIAAMRDLARSEGILAGISAGAALWAAEQVARRAEFTGKTLVVLLPDSGERYLSTGHFD